MSKAIWWWRISDQVNWGRRQGGCEHLLMGILAAKIIWILGNVKKNVWSHKLSIWLWRWLIVCTDVQLWQNTHILSKTGYILPLHQHFCHFLQTLKPGGTQCYARLFSTICPKITLSLKKLWKWQLVIHHERYIMYLCPRKSSETFDYSQRRKGWFI